MRKNVGLPLKLERRAEVQRCPASERAQQRLQTDQQHEADAQGQQQVTVMPRHYFVHCQLQEQRADDGEKLKSCRKQEDLAQSAFQSDDASGQVTEPERTGFIKTSEGRGRREFQSNAGEVPAGFAMTESSRTSARILHHNIF